MLDICSGGLGVTSNVPLRRHALYQITLRLEAREVTCQARPAHCRPRAGGTWIVGLSFERDDCQAAIEVFVDAILNSQIKFA